MPIKKYGIFLAYPPTVDLRKEGLGRYLAAFIKGGATQKNIKFVVVSPSWSHESLDELFLSEGVNQDDVELVSPEEKPLILSLYEKIIAFRKKKQSNKMPFSGKIGKYFNTFMTKTAHHMVQVYSFRELLTSNPKVLLLIITAPLILAPLIVIYLFYLFLSKLRSSSHSLFPLVKHFPQLKEYLGQTLVNPKDSKFVLKLFHSMSTAESERMIHLINEMKDVKAWYCPTAFWPDFNKIIHPRLMCVPDVVLSDFPVGFSLVTGDRILASFSDVEESIRGGQNFVTYSDSVKWDTLVERYAIPESAVNVIHHAPNNLSQWVSMKGVDYAYVASYKYCQFLLQTALLKSSHLDYTSGFSNTSVKFLFYASQFRPNKNIITLLRAYNYLLKEKYISHKLIMTGNPDTEPSVLEFIKNHHLENDVLCLHGLSVQELAACYKLADLAVNPSLSEGGCPFTFTEALSVDTPVIMARIPVTEEILTEADLREMTFFDPYNWKDMAERISWALKHRSQLLQRQSKTYRQLSQRTWEDVVGEHIEILDRISGG